jgi:hypothetical protein
MSKAGTVIIVTLFKIWSRKLPATTRIFYRNGETRIIWNETKKHGC